MTRVLILTRSLGKGGAERQLAELVRAIDKSRFDLTVAAFYGGGAFWKEVERFEGVHLVSLAKSKRWDITGAWRSARDLLRERPVDVIYGYREEGNLLALPLARMAHTRLVWGIRRSTKALPLSDPFALGIHSLGIPLSRMVNCVVYNSNSGKDIYVRRGYSARNAVVVPNGFDISRFRPDAEARKRQRIAWDVAEKEPLIGIVGRLHPVKDHHLFLEAAAHLVGSNHTVRFVVVGGGHTAYLNSLQSRAEDLGIGKRVLWAGESDEMVGVYNALDIAVLCSKEEGCPNVVGEAMACGVPCVVTDVGDAAAMVGDAGLVTSGRDHRKMATCLLELLDLPSEARRQMGLEARGLIVGRYSLKAMVARTSDLLEGIALA